MLTKGVPGGTSEGCCHDALPPKGGTEPIADLGRDSFYILMQGVPDTTHGRAVNSDGEVCNRRHGVDDGQKGGGSG